MPIDKKISQLPVASSINSTDVSVLVHGGIDYQFAFSTLLTFISNNAALGANVSFGTAAPTGGKNGDIYIKTNSNQFFQKISGTWTVFYTVPISTPGNSVLFGSAAPASGTGVDGDVYINVTGGIFYKKISGTWTTEFTMATGPAGPRGNSVLNGIIDPTSGVGVNGDFYINTTAETIFGPKASGAWPAGVSLKGINGNTLLSGTSNPTVGIGNNGDFYINTLNFNLFGPKAGGVWPAGQSIIGADGQGVPVGGTTGQVLAKNSNTDFDTHWVAFSLAWGAITGTLSDQTDLQAALDNKVDKVTGKQLSTEDYTTAEKSKLAALTEHYVGYFASLSALNTAHPTGLDGQYATVDVGVGSDAKTYIWDDNDNAWILGSGSGGVTSVNSQTGAVILTTDDIGEGSTNLYFTVARALAAVISGFSTATNAQAANGDTILVALGKLQAQINGIAADGIVSGMVTSTVTTTATTTAGSYRLNNVIHTLGSSTNTTIPAQDATLNRYTLIVGDTSGALSAVNGTLAADAVEPDIPANKALIASIYIPVVGGTVTTGGGGSGKGTVTKVTSTTTDILVANSTTTPALTLNKVNGMPIAYYDPTSSIQTQLNAKAVINDAASVTTATYSSAKIDAQIAAAVAAQAKKTILGSFQSIM